MYLIIKRTIDKEYIPLAIFIASICISSVLMLRVVLPLWQSATMAKRELVIYQSLVKGTSEYEELKNEIREKQKLLEIKHTELTQGMADPHDLSGLLQMIFDKAWAADIRFDKTMPQKEIHGRDYIHYPVSLEMTTTYNNFGMFISSLEKLPQIVRIDRTQITALPGESIAAKILVTCFLSLHDRKEIDATKSGS